MVKKEEREGASKIRSRASTFRMENWSKACQERIAIIYMILNVIGLYISYQTTMWRKKPDFWLLLN